MGLDKLKPIPTVKKRTTNAEYYSDHLLWASDAKFYNDELILWIVNENDPIKLASAACLINCWDWPDFMPLPSGEYNFKRHGYTDNYLTYDYDQIKFFQDLMHNLERKCENISPGTYNLVWRTNMYRKYATVTNYEHGSV